MIDLQKLPIKTGPVKKGKEKADDIQSPAIIAPSPQSNLLRRRRHAVADITFFSTHTQAQSTDAHEPAVAAASSSNIHEFELDVASPPLIPR